MTGFRYAEEGDPGDPIPKTRALTVMVAASRSLTTLWQSDEKSRKRLRRRDPALAAAIDQLGDAWDDWQLVR